MKIERRDNGHKPSWRTEGDKRIIEGYAAVFYRADDPGTEYRLFGNHWERILPGAFDESLRSDDIHALFNHDRSLVLGRNRSGTLKLSVDERGLFYRVDLPDSPPGNTVWASLQRGDVDQSSFGFLPRSGDERAFTRVQDPADPERTIREVRNVTIFDVGPATRGAYPSTSAEVGVDRCGEEAELCKRWLDESRDAQAEKDRRRSRVQLEKTRLTLRR